MDNVEIEKQTKTFKSLVYLNWKGYSLIFSILLFLVLNFGFPFNRFGGSSIYLFLVLALIINSFIVFYLKKLKTEVKLRSFFIDFGKLSIFYIAFPFLFRLMHNVYYRSSSLDTFSISDVFSSSTFIFLYILFYLVDLVFKFIKNKKLCILMFILSVITLLFILFNPLSLSIYIASFKGSLGLGVIYYVFGIPLFVFFVVLAIVYYKRWKSIDNNLTKYETTIKIN